MEKSAISININGDIKNANCAFQKFISDGPIALLPYSKDEASIVWSLKNNSKNLILGNGNADSPLMLVGEAPGKTEDDTGLLFQGEVGDLLNKMLYNLLPLLINFIIIF